MLAKVTAICVLVLLVAVIIALVVRIVKKNQKSGGCEKKSVNFVNRLNMSLSKLDSAIKLQFTNHS